MCCPPRAGWDVLKRTPHPAHLNVPPEAAHRARHRSPPHPATPPTPAPCPPQYRHRRPIPNRNRSGALAPGAASPNFAAATKPNPAGRPPERRYLCLQLVTHHIEFVPRILFGRMNRRHSRGQREASAIRGRHPRIEIREPPGRRRHWPSHPSRSNPRRGAQATSAPPASDPRGTRQPRPVHARDGEKPTPPPARAQTPRRKNMFVGAALTNRLVKLTKRFSFPPQTTVFH